MSTDSTPSHSVRRLNHLAHMIDARSYLEIGVDRGDTFREVWVDEKVGVDPGLKVKASTLDSPGARIEKVPSDEFFASLRQDATFDLVFIDGLHVFEQAYRDFCNAIVHTHSRSVIVIDDTRPSDVYSTIRDQDRAIETRWRERSRIQKVRRRRDTSWHGDVYKVVFAIHDFHPGFDYATTTRPENPQTIVWRSRAFKRSPIFDSFERIGRLSYFDLLEAEDALRPMAEAEALETCASALR